jgi:hypothetical protein
MSSSVKILPKAGTTQELDKRTYLPYLVEAPCPKCGTRSIADLTQEYLSYPTVPGVEKVSVCCRSCDEYFRVPVRIDVVLEPVGEPEPE